jgi:hypothetical protein
MIQNNFDVAVHNFDQRDHGYRQSNIETLDFLRQFQ